MKEKKHSLHVLNLNLKFPNQKSLFIKCVEGKYFKVVGYRDCAKHIDELQCSFQFRGNVVQGPHCLVPYWNVKWHYYGFEGNDGFRIYFKTCYDEFQASPFYSVHILQGDSRRFARTSERSTDFTEGMVRIEKVDELYEQKNTEQMFETLLGPDTLETIKEVSFLARGHLNPNADGALPYFKRLTFFHDNAVPQWQIINTSNWKRVENAAWEKAMQLKQDLLIFTGVYDILRLPDDLNTEHPIYLHNDKLKVPKWMWKVIKDTDKDESIAFVTFNNPFRKPDEREILCNDVCSKYGWDKLEFLNHRKGFTYCCQVERLTHIGMIPSEAVGKNVMKNLDSARHVGKKRKLMERNRRIGL